MRSFSCETYFRNQHLKLESIILVFCSTRYLIGPCIASNVVVFVSYNTQSFDLVSNRSLYTVYLVPLNFTDQTTTRTTTVRVLVA